MLSLFFTQKHDIMIVVISMKRIEYEEVVSNVKRLCLEASFSLEDSFIQKIKDAQGTEKSPIGKKILEQIEENERIASSEHIPMCQDTGIVVAFVEIGNVIVEFDIYDAINEGIRQAYKEGYLRNSVLNDPFERVNTSDNTPGIIHIRKTTTDHMKITIAPKGGGSENMSRLKMLTPAEGYEGVKKFVIETVELAGGKTCPPIIVGVGVGGNFEKAALLAKEAVLRDINDQAKTKTAQKLEIELLEEINKLGIGPMGLGGTTTAIAVKVNTYPCHIAALPVAVNLQCHASRHRSVIL